MTTYPKDRHGLIRRESALVADISDDHIAAAIRNGDLISVAPGATVEPSKEFDGPDGADGMYRLRAIAVATSHLVGDTPHPLSHASAAALHRLPLLHPDRRLVHVTTGRPSGGSKRTLRHLHPGTLSSQELTEVDGVRVTSLERTAVDVAAAGNFAQALTAFDGAARLGADIGQMRETLETRRPRGVRTARRALTFVDGRSESVGESWSRAQMIEAGLPLPRLQHRYRVGARNFYVDFDWDERLAGEFDGMQKYGGLLKPGQTAADAVLAEKVREDELRALGPMVIRWTWVMLERNKVVELVRGWLHRLGLLAG